jgi:penicillin-binding protein 2
MTLAGSLKSKVMVDTFNLLNLGRPTGIRLPEEQAGIVLGSKQWRREIRPGATLTPADLAQMSIGQSDSLATPLQICGITATIANGGKYYQPRIIRQVVGNDPSGEHHVILEDKAQVKVDLIKEGMEKEQIEIIRQGMWLAANKLGGTARSAALKNVEIGAKTGTAQVSKTNLKNSHNAWTTSFAPFESPRYAVTVMVSNGKSGGLVAGALTHLIYRSLFAMEAGLDPRLTKMGVYAGHFEPIEKIELPEGELVTLDIADAGETGNEVGDELFQEGQPVLVKPKTIPLPSFTPQPDEPDGGQ